MNSSRAGAPSVIFDLDGTLVDSEPNAYESMRLLLGQHGVPDFTWEQNARFIGISNLEALTVLRTEYGIAASADELVAGQDAIYLELARKSTEVFPRMREFVELLHDRGIAVAVASGSSPAGIEAVLASTGLDAFFTTYVSADEVPRGKPEPDVFLEAARRLGAAPADCVVVEDAVPGARAAHAAGMRCIAVPYLPACATDPAFAATGLLFPGGQDEFTAQAAYAWLFAATAPAPSGPGPAS
ncbi:HAD family hydrolase [Streptomyces sp. NBC_00385]|uniref:HAD family hydrolase n=1 Tax=Streptomyces sp. NBC_00385 TaxID=2975733 RepID=UPI002DD7BB89|nr:HAD family phosphatase [Streptomyces sp. NBC_00385]WRZ08322.1 HAD family phosphatase [Streptomyces sp. NBC_00385]